MLLKSGVFLTLCLFTLQASQIKELHDINFSGLRDVRYRYFLEASRPIRHETNVRAEQDGRRVKRSTLHTTGVKVCPQDTMKTVIDSHRAYYKLRVCQEAIWEAFRIFLDRVPSPEEYRAWVNTCQHENLCMDELAQNFSSSQEHLDMMARRVAEQAKSEGFVAATEDPHSECSWTPPPILLPVETDEVKDPNLIKENYEEYIVEFSITISDPTYSELLSNSEAPQYDNISRELRDKMVHVFEKVPGFKEIRVLGFRSEDLSVRYAVIFNGETELNDDSESLEKEHGKETNGDANAPKLRHIIVKALNQEPTLLLDIQTLNFEAVTTVYPVVELSMDSIDTAPSAESTQESEDVNTPTQSLFLTVEVLQNKLENSGTVKPKTQTSVPFIPSILPKTSSSFTVRTSSMAAAEEKPTEEVREEEETPLKDGDPELVYVDSTEHPVGTSSSQPGGDQTDAPLKVNLDPPQSTAPTVQDTDTTEPADPLSIFSSGEDAIQGSEPESDVQHLPSPVDRGEARDVRYDLSGEHSGVTPVAVTLPGDNSNATEGVGLTDLEEEESGSGFASESDEGPYGSTAPPAVRHANTPLMTAVEKSKELVVFFSLRVTNMMFTDDLFNKSSPEYKSLENTFLELLLPYLQTNLTGFKQLEILNFRNGSVVVNSRMKLDKPVPYNVTEAVHCVLEDLCSAASNRLDIEIDSRSLEVEPADQADPCKFLACNAFSRCVVNSWTNEAECLCDPGYSTVDGLPCQSTCSLQPEYCMNGGLCEIIPGHGVTCRCPVGKYWHYHGERCSELVSVPLDPSLIITCLVGSLCLVCAVIGILIFINKKCIKTRKAVALVHTHAPYAFENTLRENPVFENDDGVLTHVSTLPCPSSSASSNSQQSEQEHFASIENIHLSIEIPRQLYTTRSEKLVSDMVGFHHSLPHSELFDDYKGKSLRTLLLMISFTHKESLHGFCDQSFPFIAEK
ncbi:interphotoreceptor matrix proteoglycan 1 isoform X4 [Girardinichthys multiradiatus]|uniref:interphotoreceptor matrix proteoglycan 1 isoform X4 n=1 Tax=Girardinichthys multiradiatus TaxID=208333 RepID=UPI001FAE1258|nr:interphotoreceptor matrix proteoglycan 1 isoform X4 [Girardinichthys multiradiatus]